MNTLLTVENLKVNFDVNGQDIAAVRGVSFSLNRGETLALVGESGSGKSVTAMSIVRLLPPAQTRYGAESRIQFEGVEVLTSDEETLRRLRGNRIGMIFQEPMTSLNPFMRIGAQLTEALHVHQTLSKAEAEAKAKALLERVGLNEVDRRFRQYPHQFSGGQLQRIMIAMALMNEPDLLIADEPTTALDVTIQAEILDLLHDLQRQLGMAIIFITHDLGLAEHYAEKVCVMRQGEIVERGPIAAVFAAPQHDYTRELINATPRGLKEPLPAGAPLLLAAEHIGVEYITARSFFGRPTKRFAAVRDIDLRLHSGQTIGIVGESGSGKSTLGKALLGMVPHTGTVCFQGEVLERLTPAERKRHKAQMQVVFQDPFGSLSPRLTIGEIVGEGLRVHQPQLSRAERQAKVAAILEEVALGADTINRYPHEFSGGQRQRIAIARAVILEPKFILLDEPTSALDRSIQVKVVELLRNLQQKYGLSYIFISHDLAVVRAMSDEVLVMQAGAVVERGSTDAIFNRPQTDYTRRLIESAFDL